MNANNELEPEECAVCSLELAVSYPLTLECGHTFCSFCVQGVSTVGNGLCPMCRAPIRREALEWEVVDIIGHHQVGRLNFYHVLLAARIDREDPNWRFPLIKLIKNLKYLSCVFLFFLLLFFHFFFFYSLISGFMPSVIAKSPLNIWLSQAVQRQPTMR